MTTQQLQFWKLASKTGSIADNENPLFALQQVSTSVLTMFLTGKVDVIELIKMETTNRGRDENGQWVGFKPKTSPERLEASKKAQAKKKDAKKKVAEPKALEHEK
jgi:hypothetical protein